MALPQNKLKLLHDTWLKALPHQSESLPNHLKVRLPKDAVLNVHSYATEAENQHIIVTFGKDAQGNQISFHGLNRWHVFTADAVILNAAGEVSREIPTEIQKAPAKAILRGAIKLPGYNSTFYLNQPIIPNGHIYWDEATHAGSRIPQSKQHVDNIITVATRIEPWLLKLGKAFNVTSFYRPEPFNSAVGGARQSTHLKGMAIDGYVHGMNRRQLSNFFKEWDGGLGIYNYDAYIIHLDVFNKRRWGGAA